MVEFTRAGMEYIAKAIDINADGELLVETGTGERLALSSGEISLKKK
jgi:biotin-(acetyl-CoA carboxylase) ligase